MSEWIATLREALTALARSDPQFRRFGAARHRYALAPPADEVDRELPDDLRAFATELGAGGAGPYYGLLPVDRTAAIDAAAGVEAWRRALPLSHLGCGYAAVMPLDGPARGQIWIDARALSIVAPIRPSFTAFYLDWIERLARGQWLEAFVPAGRCALAGALTGYLGLCERQLGVAAGSLDGPPLREALGRLGPGSIELAGGPPLFATGDRVDPCVSCARLIDNLVEQGLAPDVVAPGVAVRGT